MSNIFFGLQLIWLCVFANLPPLGELKGAGFLKKLRGVETPRFKPKLSAARLCGLL